MSIKSFGEESHSPDRTGAQGLHGPTTEAPPLSQLLTDEELARDLFDAYWSGAETPVWWDEISNRLVSAWLRVAREAKARLRSSGEPAPPSKTEPLVEALRLSNETLERLWAAIGDALQSGRGISTEYGNSVAAECREAALKARSALERAGLARSSEETVRLPKSETDSDANERDRNQELS